MIKLRKNVCIVAIACCCVYVLLFSVIISDSYATNLDFDTNVQTGVDMVENAMNLTEQNSSDSVNNANTNNTEVSNNTLTPDVFMEDVELPEKESAGHWQDELLKPEDFIDPNASLEEFENTVLQRMLDVVSFIQNITKPLCIIFFIICALGVLVSIVFGTNKHKTFILGLILSVIVYVGVIFAPNIVLFLADWLSF